MTKWFGSIPVTVRLPLLAAAMILFASVFSTQVSMYVMERQTNRQAEAFGQIYLDGLSTALLPHAVSSDTIQIAETLKRAMLYHDGIIDRRLAFLTDTGKIIDVTRPNIVIHQTLPKEVKSVASGLYQSGNHSFWVWRPLRNVDGQHLGTIAANLDLSAFVDERIFVRGLLLLFDLIFSSGCAMAGFFLVRGMQRPLTIFAQRLYDAALNMSRPISPNEIPSDNVQARRMMHAFNAMIHATREREGMIAHLAEQQRYADLGRLTATIAHEVKNPLGGMRTAISTLQSFGDQLEPRREAVDFLERGIVALEHVVDATLGNYRIRPDYRPLKNMDLEDLLLLIEPDGHSRGVSVELRTNLTEDVDVPALELRQIILNLLLNAVRASEKGETVRLQALKQDNELLISVQDQGRGMDQKLIRTLEEGENKSQETGIGVAVIIRLVERLQGKVSIASDVDQGTKITLRLPLQKRSHTT